MNKIPVGRTISHAYSFAFKDFFRILGVMWVTFAILVIMSLLLRTQMTAFTTALVTKNFAALGSAIFILVPFYILSFFLLFMQIVGITQEALGLRTGSPYFYFSLGAPVWRLIGAYLLVVALMIAAIAVVLIGAILIAAIFGAVSGVTPGSKPSGGTATALGLGVLAVIFIVYPGFIYALVRQTFLLTPVSVAENKLGLRRAWQLGRGNFWRMFAIILSILIPLLIVEAIFFVGFVWHGLPPSPVQGATPEQVVAFNTASMTRVREYWYLTYPIFLVLSVILYGLICGAQAFAYRYLVTAENTEALV